MQRYPEQSVWEEVTYLAFHLHWSLEELLDLPHRNRRHLVELVGGLAERHDRIRDAQ